MERERDDEEILPVPADAETLGRLARLARAAGKHPIDLAAELLHDLLLDDEAANVDSPLH